jgi:hypothetical protein
MQAATKRRHGPLLCPLIPIKNILLSEESLATPVQYRPAPGDMGNCVVQKVGNDDNEGWEMNPEWLGFN